MENFDLKIIELKKAISLARLTAKREDYKRGSGAPMVAMMDVRLVQAIGNHDSLRLAYNCGFIGNNGHNGSIINNSKNVSEYFN